MKLLSSSEGGAIFDNVEHVHFLYDAVSASGTSLQVFSMSKRISRDSLSCRSFVVIKSEKKITHEKHFHYERTHGHAASVVL